MKIDKARERFKKLLRIHDSLKNHHYRELVNETVSDKWATADGTSSVRIGLAGMTFQEFGKKFNL